MAAAENDSLTSIYAQPVGFHPYTQKISLAQGMAPCAVSINYTGSDVAMSYFTERHRQHLFMAVRMMADSRRTVYCPDDARDVVDMVVRNCGLDRTYGESAEPAKGSVTSLDVDVHQKTASGFVFVRRAGADAETAVRRANMTLKGSRCEVAYIYINMQDPSAATAYEAATALGYFVVGMFPGTSDNDWLIMHNTFIGGIDYGSFAAEGPFAELLEAVRRHDPEGYL